MSAGWDRVAETVKRRRVELSISQRQAAALAGVSPTTWGSLEKDHNPVSDLTAGAICGALRWTSDSIARILRGDEPEPNGDTTPLSPTERIKRLEAAVDSLTELVAGLVAERQPDGESGS